MKKTYDTLYSRDSKGKIRIWKMEQDGANYRTISGLQDGKQVISAFTRALGKNLGKANETSEVEQATSEIESAYTKQLKTGYSGNIDNVDNETFISPMLAKGFINRLDKVVYPVLVDIKYNGGRVVTQKSGQFSRKGEKKNNIPHLYESLEYLFKQYPKAFFDGEGYNHDYRYKLNEIMKLLNKDVHFTAETLKASREKIKYYIYDGYGFGNIDANTKMFERRAALIKLLKDIPYIVPVVGKMADKEADVWKIYEEYVSDGYEGAVIRLNDKYSHNRSSSLLKLKPEDSDEGVITAIHEGEGNWSGTGKTMTLSWRGREVDCTFKGNYEACAQFLKDKNKWIGKEITFLHNGLTGLGLPCFARMDINNNTAEK